MAQIVNLSPPTPAGTESSPCSRLNPLTHCYFRTTPSKSWCPLSQKKSWKYNGRVYSLFSDNRKQEQARKAVEGALSGKKNEIKKWNKEIKRREESVGGGASGGGGWFGWGRWFGWSNGDHFWQEAWLTILTILGIVLTYFIVAKGDVLLAVGTNSFLLALRGTRSGFTFITSKVLKRPPMDNHINSANASRQQEYIRVSAKENVIRKWGSG